MPLVRAMKAVSRLISSSRNSRQLVAGVDQDRRQIAVVGHVFGQRDAELAVVEVDAFDQTALFEQPGGGLGIADDADVQERSLAHLFHDVGDVGVDQAARRVR